MTSSASLCDGGRTRFSSIGPWTTSREVVRGPLLFVLGVVSVALPRKSFAADASNQTTSAARVERRLEVIVEPSFDPAEREQLLAACERALREGRCVVERSGAGAPLVGRVSRIEAERVRLFVGRDEASAQVLELSFAVEDSPAERARAIGLSLGSLAASAFEAEKSSESRPEAEPPPPATQEPPPEIEEPASTNEAASSSAASRALVLGELGLGLDPGLPRAEIHFGALARIAPFTASIFPRLGLHGATSLAERGRETWVRIDPTLGFGTHVLLPFGELDLSTDVGLEWLEASRGSSSATRVTPYWAVAATALVDWNRRWGTSLGVRLATPFSPTDVYVDGVRTASSTAIVGAVFLGFYHRLGED